VGRELKALKPYKNDYTEGRTTLDLAADAKTDSDIEDLEGEGMSSVVFPTPPRPNVR